MHNAAREQGLVYPVDFASRGSCAIGGTIATNAGGIRVIRYGNTREWIAGLKVAITGSNSAPLSVPTDALVGGSWNAEAAATLAQLVRKTSNVLKTTVAGVGYRRRVLLALAPRTVDALWQGG